MIIIYSQRHFGGVFLCVRALQCLTRKCDKKCVNERYNLQIMAPEYKRKLFGKKGER